MSLQYPHPLVGRQREREILLQGLSALGEGEGEGRGGLYLLSGEPGIGKTRLADEVARQAEGQGITVAWGAAWDGGAAPAYWPWIEVVRALRPLLPEPDRQLRRDLGPLWADGGAGDGGAPDPGEAGTKDPELLGFRRFDALRALVQEAAGQRSLLLILEDLHAADQASLQALLLIARSVRRLPVMVLGTHRPTDATGDVEGAKVDRLLARLAREGTALPLSRLTRGEVASLLDDLDPLPPRLLEDVYQASGGNPLFVGESLRVVRTGGRLQEAAEGLSALIRERLGRFDVKVREALELAAVLGREVERPVLAEACGIDIEQLEANLRGPRQAGLIQAATDTRQDGDQRLQFVHGLYRERLVDDLTPERRAVLHRRVAQALLRRRAAGHLEAEEPLARHLLAAGVEGDPGLAVEWAVRAGRGALAALAFDRAVELFEGALAACDPLAADAPGPAAQRIDIELELAEALARVGAGVRSRALCLVAADQARARGDAVRLARAALAFGAELRPAVVDAALVSLLREALAALGEGEPRLRARVMARLAAAQQPASDPQVPVAEARAAIALAQSTGDPQTLLVALYSGGSALVDYAPADERLPLDRQLVALALPRGELTLGQQGYARLAIDGFELGDLEEVELAIAGHERLGRALGHPRWRWRAPLLRSMRALLAGDWQQSDAAVAEAAALIAETDDASALGTLLIHQAGALRAREAADPRQVPTFQEPALTGVEYVAELASLLRASIFARLGDLASARRCLDTLSADLRRLGADPMAIAMLADAVTAVGDRARAAQLLPLVEAYRGRCLSWGVFGLIWEGPVTAIEGTLQATLGQWAAAVAPLEQALAMAEAIGARPLAARAGRELGWALWHRGQPGDQDRARQHLGRATALAAELGMVHLQAAIARTSAALGGGKPAPTRSPPPADAVGPPPAIQLSREGEIWRLTWAGRDTRLKHTRGLEILEQLLREPGREFHVLALGGVDAGEVIDLGDAGELLDEDARTAYRQRLGELEQEMEEAQAWADTGRRDRLQAEIEFLSDELGRAVGLGGRARRSGAAVERARSNVQKRIRAVIRKLDETWPELASHLDTYVRTGTYVSYRG